MTRGSFLGAVAIAGIGTGLLAGPPLAAQRPTNGGDNLWRRAAALAAASSNLLPGAMSFHMQEARPNGDVVSTQAARYRLERQPAGAVLRQVARTTDGERAELQDEERRAAEVRPETPLDMPAGREVSYAWSESARVSGKLCERYTFRATDDEGRTSVGTLCIDPLTAAPVEVRSTFDRLPPLVRELDLVMTFAHYGDKWAPAEVITTARAGLFGRRLFTVTLEFVDWQP